MDQSGSSGDLRALHPFPLDLDSLTSRRRSASATSLVYAAEFRDPTQGYTNTRLSADAVYRAMFDNDQVVNMGSSSSAKAMAIASKSGKAATAPGELLRRAQSRARAKQTRSSRSLLVSRLGKVAFASLTRDQGSRESRVRLLDARSAKHRRSEK